MSEKKIIICFYRLLLSKKLFQSSLYVKYSSAYRKEILFLYLTSKAKKYSDEWSVKKGVTRKLSHANCWVSLVIFRAISPRRVSNGTSASEMTLFIHQKREIFHEKRKKKKEKIRSFCSTCAAFLPAFGLVRAKALVAL